MKSVVALFALTAIAVACSSSREGFNDTPAPAPSSSFDSDAAAPPADASDPCLSDTLSAVPVPLAMLLVMDRSGSMDSPVGARKWDQARSAMIGFADTKGAAGTKLGLAVFPPDPESSLDRCLPSSYAPIVPIAPLPANGSVIKDALMSREPSSDTPMAAALRGGIDDMKTYLATNPYEEGVLILVTDGDPSACSDDNVSTIANIAAIAALDKPRIRTFVVGMDGATFGNLDIIAKAGGGAPSAFNASATSGGVSPQQQLMTALESIRAGAVACEYVMPTTEKGKVDLDSVDIAFDSGTGEPSLGIKRVADESDCGAATGGFYFDDPNDPKRIVLCPASCDTVKKGTQKAKVDLVLGCITPIH